MIELTLKKGKNTYIWKSKLSNNMQFGAYVIYMAKNKLIVL